MGRCALVFCWLLGILTVSRRVAGQEPTGEYLAIEHHPAREELVLVLGPIDLPAHTPHHELRQIPIQRGIVPFDLTIDGFRVEVVDREGRPVPQVILHHTNLIDPSHRELFLPIMRRVLAASHETGPQSWPEWLAGIPLEGGTPFLFLAMLHNPTNRSYDGVTVRLIIAYARSRVLPVYRMYSFHMDVMFPVGSKAFDLPPGRTVMAWEGSPAIRGAIVGIGGHLHRYATELRLEDVTAGRVLYRVEPVVGKDGHIEKVPASMYRGHGIGLPIFPSHVYRVSVTYFNPTDRVIPEGGMGSVAGGFLPDDDDVWPAADPEDPIYSEDYRLVLRSLDMPESHPAESEDGTGKGR